ncbi:rho GTPase-activating protein gacF isoform X2 [Drosophila innubila]|uniref:rho GTPase-activating protein gacF isoform X2 n=1 Tax=Drosophila innubila TaxID=198719 RepID=UPI00148CCBCB|nr:rho GTPase-activating protein gacF isoform X2 [Drosophila innubila]
MVNVPPPLLCSTPPPIDFGEDDDDSGLQSTLHLEDGDGDADEFSEYGLVTETHEVSLSTKVPSIPELPISTSEHIAQPLAPELSNGHSNSSVTAKPTVEAFNYQVKAPQFDAYEQEMPPPLPEIDDPEDFDKPNEEQEAEAEEETNTNDNIPSLKLDSLSLYSSESISPTCTLSPVADEQATKAPVLCHQVTLEDVTDDSDEECSPKKPKELFIPEGADDFFAIEIVATPTLQQVPAALSNQIPNVEHTFAAFQETPPVDISQPSTNVNGVDEDVDDDDDFGDFADFSEAPAPVESRRPEPVMSNDDGFDDFQDFATPSTTTVEAATVENNDDDDDFGDFSEPSFVSVEAAVTPVLATPGLPQPPPPAATVLNITERVKPVLDLMFPNHEASSAQIAAKQTPLAEVQSLHFGAIEQAHALDYQWVSSEMQHSLVRSLGIDSRNILFGDKWNSSMPRFAANLSYDPLKPLKPLSAANTAASSVLDTTSSWQSPNNNNNNSTLQSLEDSHVQTLQLEQQQPQQLDQVTMVANADKINLVTSNYSHNLKNNNNHDALDAMMELYDNPNDKMTINNNHHHHHHHNNNNNNQCNANTNDMHNFVTHFATICNNNNNNNTNNNHAITTTTTTTTTITNTTTTNNTNITAHVALLDLSKFSLASCVL